MSTYKFPNTIIVLDNQADISQIMHRLPSTYDRERARVAYPLPLPLPHPPPPPSFSQPCTTKRILGEGHVEEYVDAGQCGPINEIKRYTKTTAVVRYCSPANQGCILARDSCGRRINLVFNNIWNEFQRLFAILFERNIDLQQSIELEGSIDIL